MTCLYDFRVQRIFVEAPLHDGVEVHLKGKPAHYLLHVLRLGVSGRVLLFNGHDGEWLFEIFEIKKRDSCTLKAITCTRTQTEPFSFMYLFAPLKQARLDYMVQKAVEMGVGVLQPVITAHTQVRKLNLERLRFNAIEAAEQCGLLNLPHICPVLPLAEVLQKLQAEKTLIFCDETAPRTQTFVALQAHSSRITADDCAVLIGPEGGFNDTERALIQAHGNTTSVSLGPRILRADTAAVAAFALVQNHLGDWQA